MTTTNTPATSATFAISKAQASLALSDSWHAVLNVARDNASSATQALDALANELLPHVTALSTELASPDPAAAAAAQRALDELQAVALNEPARQVHLAASGISTAALTAGLKLAATWLGVLVKAVVLA